MSSFSPSFKKLVFRLSLVGLFVLIFFPVGAFVYVRTISAFDAASLKNFTNAVQRAADHDVTVTAGGQNFSLPADQIRSWVQPYTRSYTGQDDLRFSNDLEQFVAKIAKAVDRDPIDARLTVGTNGKVSVFTPSADGVTLDIDQASAALRSGLLAGNDKIALSVQATKPKVNLDTINSLGINTKIATGQSNFAGSSKARIRNIEVSSDLYNGYLIAPGQTFSFNDILGPVDASGGYLPEKVIKNHAIVYEYGGGICQVSTTMFRAAIYAGFPIIERHAHAFPVEYYNPQGFDATIYPGVDDLKFVNDTSGYVLIQTHISGTDLYFDFYGTSDGRKVTVDGPHQYNIQSNGAMDAYFTRTITMPDGTSTSKRFTSIYRSPVGYATIPNPYD
ncbi:MAG TPA: VanW family protein [Candidatus Paceibacterota bacterium]|nr:VanW family protein [Candidatus Paceibacterota bacterium]